MTTRVRSTVNSSMRGISTRRSSPIGISTRRSSPIGISTRGISTRRSSPRGISTVNSMINRSSTRVRRTVSSIVTSKKYKPQIIFKAEFMDKMYDNMWQYINDDTLKVVFPKLKIHINGIKDIDAPDTSCFTNKHKNTICFKGDITQGHYVYVDSNMKSKGTYECNLLRRDEDDGVCHGAAIAYYLCEELKWADFCLNDNPTTQKQYKENYIIILKTYLHIINTGKWDKALYHNFHDQVDWLPKSNKNSKQTKQTKLAKELLEKYIKHLESINV